MANEPLKKFIKKLRSLEQFAEAELANFIKANSNEVADDNVSQMFDLGQNKLGGPITPPYTAFTKSIKASKGQRTDHVTLRDTGAFHKGIALIQSSKLSFNIIGRDSKTSELNNRYDVLGLTPFTLQKWRDRAIQHLIPAIDKQLST